MFRWFKTAIKNKTKPSQVNVDATGDAKKTFKIFHRKHSAPKGQTFTLSHYLAPEKLIRNLSQCWSTGKEDGGCIENIHMIPQLTN